MLRLAALISGRGSNLRALLEACKMVDFPASVVVVGADREAGGLKHAQDFSVPSFVTAFHNYPNRKAWGNALLVELRRWHPELIILSGLMRILPKEVVDAYSPAILNTHPAYLPEFPGARAVRDALAAGARETGASVIVVDNGIDTGPIICRARVPIFSGDSELSLHERIKIVERELLISTIQDIANGVIELEKYR